MGLAGISTEANWRNKYSKQSKPKFYERRTFQLWRSASTGLSRVMTARNRSVSDGRRKFESIGMKNKPLTESEFYREALEGIASMKRNTREKRLALAALAFWDTVTREATEKKGKVK